VPTTRHAADGASRFATRFHFLSLLLAYPALLWLGRDMWFRLDEWRIVLGHPHIARLWDVFVPFDIHWATTLVLFYRAVDAVAGASSYLPYMGVTLAVFVVSVHLLWRVLRRCGVDPWVATLCSAALLVLGAGWEAMYWVLILGYTLPLAMTFAAVLVADRDDLRAVHRVGIAALTLVAVMSSGAGVAMVVVPGIVVALRRGVRDGFGVIAPAVVVYALWLALAGSSILDHPGGASTGLAGGVARFVWDGLAASTATLIGPTVIGAVALVALVGWMGVRWRRKGVPPAVPACACGAVAMFLLTAVGRANGGDATLPHYLSTGVALLMPAIALAVTDVLHALRRRGGPALSRVVVYAGLCTVVAHSAWVLTGAAAAASNEDQQSRRIMVAAATLSGEAPPLADSYPEPHLGWAVSAADIVALRDRGDLRAASHLPPALATEVALRLRVAVSTTPVGDTPPRIVDVRDATLVQDGACTIARGSGADLFTVAVSYAGPGAMRVTALTPEALHAFLRGSVDSPDDEVQPTQLLAPGDSRYVDDVAPGTSVLLRFIPGSVRLCP
jgi:hypothetical protein